MKVIVAGIAGVAVLLTMLLGAAGGDTAAACGLDAGDTQAVSGTLPDTVGTWQHQQVQIAATLVTAAHDMHVTTQATTILVMTAMGESSLTNLNHGDAVDNSTIGVLQQDASYGPRADRLNPEKAAKAFLTRLLNVPEWEKLEPTIAAHKVQINADPYHYAKFWPDAQTMVAAITGSDDSGGGCVVSADQTELAKTLAEAWKKHTFTDTYHPQMVEQEILPIADGKPKPGCQVDTRVLQLLVAALHRYGSVQISDMNRPCVGVTIHCPGSLHCKVPAVAVDFNAVGGTVLLGSGAANIEFLRWLDTVVPKGSQAGQVQCRPSTPLTNLRQFSDDCSHQHIDFGATTDPLTLTGTDH